MLISSNPDNSNFISQLPLHLAKIQTIWNKLVYVGWVETTFTNLDKTLLKLINISEKNQYHDLYYQSVDIHRIFNDILKENRTPSVYEFNKINTKITKLCNHQTIKLINPNFNLQENKVFKIAILHTLPIKNGIGSLFTQHPSSKIVQCSTADALVKIDKGHKLDAILVYMENKNSINDFFDNIKNSTLNCKNMIAISPRTDAHLRLQAIRFQCNDFLQTPLNEKQLHKIIKSNQLEKETVNVVGIFKHAKDTSAFSKLLETRNIHMHCSITPLDIIHDAIEQQAQVILFLDIEEAVLKELILLLQSHPETCTLPIVYATTKQQCTIEEQLSDQAVLYLPNYSKNFEQLTNKIYALGKHVIHQNEHHAYEEASTQNNLSIDEFINEFQYIRSHTENEEALANHYFFNIDIHFLTNNEIIENLGFSQLNKLAQLTKLEIESLLQTNDIICFNTSTNFLLIKEAISSENAEFEIKALCNNLNKICLPAKPNNISIKSKCCGMMIENNHSIDHLIEMTQKSLNSENQESTALINHTNHNNLRPITTIHNFEKEKELKQPTISKQEKSDVMLAFNQGGIFMKYQPIVDVQQNLAVFEAYARLCDTNDKCFEPSMFFPILTQQNLAHEFNRKIIERTLTELSSHNKISQEADLILKLLPSNDPNEDILNKILPWFSNQLSSHRLLGKNRIIFELSEPWIIKHFEQAKNFTEKVKILDCSICIDHCDLNETSLKIMDDLKPSYIKIEPSIKKQIIDQSNIETLKVLEKFAHSPAHLVASCVETADEFSALWDKGIRYFQGYYVQQPMDQPEFLKTN